MYLQAIQYPVLWLEVVAAPVFENLRRLTETGNFAKRLKMYVSESQFLLVSLLCSAMNWQFPLIKNM